MKNRALMLLLCAFLLLAGCGQAEPASAADGTVGGVSEAEPTASPEPEPTPEPTPEPEPVSEAVLAGHLLARYDEDYTLDAVDRESGWLLLYRAEKGIGAGCMAVNPETGQTIEGEEGAEVFLGDGCILRLEWRDEATGEPVDAYTAFYEGEGRYELYVLVYDFGGNLLSEEYIMTVEPSLGDPYLEVWDAVEQVKSRYGVAEPSAYNTWYFMPLLDMDGDAVGLDHDGNELIRYPGRGADGLYLSWNPNESIFAVLDIINGTTEVFQLD